MRDGGAPTDELAPLPLPEDWTPPGPPDGPRSRWKPGDWRSGIGRPGWLRLGRSRSRGWRSGWLVLVAVVVVVFATVLVTNRLSRRPTLGAKDVNGIVDRKVDTAISALQSQPPVASQVFAAARAGLVVIESQPAATPGTKELGTGIIINTQGDILTALHVVQGGSVIKVTFADGTASGASIKSSDPNHDIAVLTAERPPSVIVPEVLGGGAQIGDETFAIGNPLGYVASLSAGVISGLNRSIPLSGGQILSGMIQFDAAVNPGSSGGPLLNKKGQVIGIVTGLANPAGDKDFVGLGFAVPIGTAGGAAGAPAR